jgi:hypothetical protein
VHWIDEQTNASGLTNDLAGAGWQWVAVGMRGRVLISGEAIFAADFD